MIDSALLVGYMTGLYATHSLDERFDIYGDYVRQLGFDGATYTFAPRIQYEVMPDLPAVFLHTRSYPVGFLEHYSRERLDRRDFTVRKVLSGDTAPMDWREHELEGWVSEDEAGVIALARERYGIRNAISIPTMLDERGAAGASIISKKSDDDFKPLKQEQMELLVGITRLFHDANFSNAQWPLQFILPIFQSLTEKELALLRYKASGKHMKYVGDYTGIDASYAANLLSQLRKRLGGVNNDRLMYLFGLLSLPNSIPAN